MAAFERIEPGTPEWHLYYGNHIARYKFASRVLGEAEMAGPVLDAACGIGYGAKYLADSLQRAVVAIDRDAETLATAARRFGHERVTFLRDDCASLSVCASHAPFAAIVSFETIEHLAAPQAFLLACRTLLAPGGLFIASTPNARSSVGREAWPFHEQEFTAAEFVALLERAGFDNVELWGQRLTDMGRLRDQLRGELNVIRSNPFFRAGAWVQRRLRRRSIPPPLPEDPQDFEFVPAAAPSELDATDRDIPFVLLAIAHG